MKQLLSIDAKLTQILTQLMDFKKLITWHADSVEIIKHNITYKEPNNKIQKLINDKSHKPAINPSQNNKTGKINYDKNTSNQK